MKKQLLLLLFLGYGIQFCHAQSRMGLELKFVPYSALKVIASIEKNYMVRELPQPGFYYQDWLTDRKYRYRRVAYQYAQLIDKGPITKTRENTNVWSVFAAFGRAYYLNHKEFEDNFAFYVSYGVGVGLAGSKTYSYLPGGYLPGPAGDEYMIPLAGFEFGLGFEKSLSRKWVANASVEMNSILYNPLYIGLTARFLYRNY